MRMLATLILFLSILAVECSRDQTWSMRDAQRAQRHVRREAETRAYEESSRRARASKRAEKARREGVRLDRRASARQDPDFPVQLTSPGVLPVAECPTRTICPILLTNAGVPIVSMYTELRVTNGTLVPTSPAFGPQPSFCEGYVAIPGQGDIIYLGDWNSTAMTGAWSHEFNLPSTESPPDLVVHNIVMEGSGFENVRAMYQVTIQSQAQPYVFELCCGFGCNEQTITVPLTATTTTAASTTTTTAGTTTAGTTTAGTTTAGTTTAETTTAAPSTTTTATSTGAPTGAPLSVTFALDGPRLGPAECSDLILCSVFANNSGVPLISAFGEFRAFEGTFVPVSANLVPGTCSSYPRLPDVNITFRGDWNSTAISGAWSGPLNTPSATPPPLVELFQFAMAGNGFQYVEGMIRVTTESQVDFNETFCCGFGCNGVSTTAATTTATTTTTTTLMRTTTTVATGTPTGAPSPVTFEIEGPAVEPACNDNVVCTVFANNTNVPLISAFGEFHAFEGEFVPDAINVVQDICLTYPRLPDIAIVFNGEWNATSIVGAWGGPLNFPSATPPPLVELFRFVMSGNGRQYVRGMIRVTTESQVDYNETFCCGVGCTPTTSTALPSTTTAPLTTTASTAAATTPRPSPTPSPNPVTFFTVGPIVNLNCPNTLICTVYANNSGVPLISAFGDFVASDGTIMEAFPIVNSLNPCETSVSLPNIDPLEYRGFWNSTRIQGAWSGPFNMPSGVPPPFTQLINFAIDGGALKRVEGTITVTTESQVEYSASVFCGEEPPPPEVCPENATVAYRRYFCRKDQISSELNYLTDNNCIAPHVMFMNPPNTTETDTMMARDVEAPVVEMTSEVTFGDDAFTPSKFTVRQGAMVWFKWAGSARKAIVAGNCGEEDANLIYSGHFAAEHSFVIKIDHRFRSGETYHFHSKNNCKVKAQFTVA